MIIFWILAAGLAGLALVFVLPPLLSRLPPDTGMDQDQLNLEVFRQQLKELHGDMEAGNLDQTQYKAARRDLERELLHDVDGKGGAAASNQTAPITALLLALILPAFAFGLYVVIGDNAIIPRLEMAAAGKPGLPAGHPAEGGQALALDELVERLALKMEENPDNLEGWVMLGRTYVAINQPDKAVAALEKAQGLAPENPEVLLSLAQVLATAAGGQLAGRPADLVTASQEIDPTTPPARWLQGLVAYQAEDFPLAVQRWEALVLDMDPAGEDAAEIRELIAEARERGGGAPPAQDAKAATRPADTKSATSATTPDTKAAAAGAAIQIDVSLAESLWPQANINHSLFVYAKAVTGPPMPLAVKRLRVADLPLTVTLDDSLAMTPEARLSNFPQVLIGARISASGQAGPRAGDLEGETGPVTPGKKGPVKLVIDRVRP